MGRAPDVPAKERSLTVSRPPRHERLEARLSPDQKRLLERAAALEGQSLTAYVLASAQSAALETIRRHEVLTLTARESVAFTQALLHPPAPNERLRLAARHHRSLIAEE